MGVALRKRTVKNKERLYLDVYENGQRKAEFLSLYLYKRPANELEKQHNKEVKLTAETIRAKRELALSASDYEIQSSSNKRLDFLEYCDKYISIYQKKDIRMIKYSVRYLRDYLATKDRSTLPLKYITEAFCMGFRDWLYCHKNLTGETPYDFFARFKKILKAATREKLFAGNPASEVPNKMPQPSVVKDVLLIEEIQQLALTKAGNETIKRAFLLACFTGLRLCDVRVLRWEHVQGDSIKIIQQKTGKPVTVKLNSSSKKILGETGKDPELVFADLPSHTGISKVLKYWTKRAGITKHVTFHCARHSFGTNLILHEVDVATASSLLGHTSYDHTQKYIRVAENIKQKAVDKLPEIEI